MNFRDRWGFSLSDRKALVFLAVLLAVIIGIADYLSSGNTITPLSETDSINSGRTVSSREADNYSGKYYRVEGRKTELFRFDPNTADSTQLLRLGLAPWMVRNIYRYRAKGGVFRQKSDFARVYGLTRGQYRALEPYIVIGSDYQPAYSEAAKDKPAKGYADSAQSHRQYNYQQKLREGESVSLNTADTSALKRIPGIGSYFARRIVSYRERLGGFDRAEQLLEIEGFPERALRYIKVDVGGISKLHVNKMTLSQLRRHPYINYYQAKSIVDYRRLHGPLHSLGQLHLLNEFTGDDLKRLEPYVDFSY